MALLSGRIKAVKSCEDGWSTGMSYVILESTPQLSELEFALDHDIPEEVWENIASYTTKQRPVASEPSLGPWWPSTNGWAVGLIRGPKGRTCPALAWPKRETPELIRALKREWTPTVHVQSLSFLRKLLGR